MSMNIVLYAKKDGVKELFDVIQTPTEVTKKILSSKDKAEAYRTYINERTKGQTDYKGNNWYHDHLIKFNSFIKEHEFLYWENT